MFQLPSFTKNTKEEDLSLIDRTKDKAEKVITPIKDKVKKNSPIEYLTF